MNKLTMVLKIVTHGRFVQRMAALRGWGPGARYTNLRDVREQPAIAFIDIDWKQYSKTQHIAAVRSSKPFMTVIRDIESERQYLRRLKSAEDFLEWVQFVIIVPKFKGWCRDHEKMLTDRHIVGFSMPTRYGSTPIRLSQIGHQVHLLGGRPDRQRNIADEGNVVSIDCNRFTLDASYGDFFDGRKYDYSRKLSYSECLARSMEGIERAWRRYKLSKEAKYIATRWRKFCQAIKGEPEKSLCFRGIRKPVEPLGALAQSDKAQANTA